MAGQGNIQWKTDFDTARQLKLFVNPPRDQSAYPALSAVVEPHIKSFNAIWEQDGIMEAALRDIGTKTFKDGNPFADPDTQGPRNRYEVRISSVFLQKPHLPQTNRVGIKNREIFPAECRERQASYRGKLSGRIQFRINGGDWKEMIRELGQAPVMVLSNKCHLEGHSPARLVAAKEESEELGGYFIINGIERLVRMLIVARRNFPLAVVRSSFLNRGKSYTKHCVQIRSVRVDQTPQSNFLHYLNDGNITFRFSWRKSEYLVPVMTILGALLDTNDKEIFESIVNFDGQKGVQNKQFVIDRVARLIRSYKSHRLHGKTATRAYLGSKFRAILQVSEDATDVEAGTEFLQRIVLPHLNRTPESSVADLDKFKLILYMIRKLYSLAKGDYTPDNADALAHQEVLLGGFLYGMILKEKLGEWLNAIQKQTIEWFKSNGWRPLTSREFDRDFVSKVLRKTNENIGGALEYFISTGNLVSPSGLDLQQISGYTVLAERINFYRFISHFRMVHRGSFFAQLKTTSVRKLLAESWGFLCPVHTPDGAPCGLLNHLAHKCKVATQNVDVSLVPELLSKLDLISETSNQWSECITVQLDGRILGFCSPAQAPVIRDNLRYWKTEGMHGVPLELEIGYIPVSAGGQYPGLFLFSQISRLFRPVKYLASDKMDCIGPFEQPFMSIACTADEIIPGDTTHVEYTTTNLLSIVANMTPFSDFNQSPRNMYQCQMGKQSMGTPGTAIRHRVDNKLYRLQTGQTPVVRSPLHNEYGLDNFPNGTNAVVAVLSYTGYDMDDAMIINKSAHERGFGFGTVYRSEVIDLSETSRGKGANKKVNKVFGFPPNGLVHGDWKEKLGEDGLPRIGQMIRKDDILVAYHTVIQDAITGEYINLDGKTIFKKYKEEDIAYIEEVRLLGSEDGSSPLQSVSIKFRVPRSPVIGDKFSSRHGQKGVCSQKWPSIDMPFTECGLQPDVIINPHAFPSRMTIGMFVESLAGKAGSLHGVPQDSTPFKFNEKDTAIDYFGHELMRAGYNYFGNEPMYSGINGRELSADIYIGVVYYQRLRHMVNDKFQVRTTGHVNRQTGQPIKGRKRGGGIRVGEMERDALLSHGTAFLLQDRLFNCSDYGKVWICRKCKGFLATMPPALESTKSKSASPANMRCRRCSKPVVNGDEDGGEVWEEASGSKRGGGNDVVLVTMPGVLQFLVAELASIGVRMGFSD